MKCLHENHPTQEKEKSEKKKKKKKKKKLEQEQKYTWPRPQSNVSQPSHHAQAQCETHKRNKKNKVKKNRSARSSCFLMRCCRRVGRGERAFRLVLTPARGPPEPDSLGLSTNQHTIPKVHHIHVLSWRKRNRKGFVTKNTPNDKKKNQK